MQMSVEFMQAFAITRPCCLNQIIVSRPRNFYEVLRLWSGFEQTATEFQSPIYGASVLSGDTLRGVTRYGESRIPATNASLPPAFWSALSDGEKHWAHLRCFRMVFPCCSWARRLAKPGHSRSRTIPSGLIRKTMIFPGERDGQHSYSCLVSAVDGIA